MYQLLQTAVELPDTNNHTSCSVQHSLQLVSDSLWSPGEKRRCSRDITKACTSVIADSVLSVRQTC